MRYAAALVVAAALAASCSAPQLMPTPTAFIDGRQHPFEDVPEVFQTNEVDVLYVTDRSLVAGEEVTYDHERSASMAFGSCRVAIGEDIAWDDLVAESLAEHRSRDLPLAIAHTEEQGRFPDTPLDVVATDDGWKVTPEDAQRQAEVEEQLRAEIRRRLALTPRKQAFIYVHGAQRAFRNSVYNTAEIWHYLGREGIPIAYSWPAGIGGLLGYFYDRESGDFTIYHFKQLIELLTSIEELEKIDIIAHSRGTDVVLTAIRELVIAERAAGHDPRETLRLNNLVLAAPDLDLDVTMQRVGAERLGPAFERVTIYMSLGDLAIGLSSWISHSRMRIGHATKEGAPEALTRATKPMKGLTFIDARVESDLLGHAYFLTHPAVSSDMILMLRHDAEPGASNGRPLLHLGGNFWEIIGDGDPFDLEELELDEIEPAVFVTP